MQTACLNILMRAGELAGEQEAATHQRPVPDSPAPGAEVTDKTRLSQSQQQQQPTQPPASQPVSLQPLGVLSVRAPSYAPGLSPSLTRTDTHTYTLSCNSENNKVSGGVSSDL
ncbi:hypothetical protein O3P69_020362 [Scylla paramamosain]|uniref:Uncharacterized protein n=1 Tax=Scylla paramamosain TaxID=85552 RepID=A0AAW0TKP3_SCYPA